MWNICTIIIDYSTVFWFFHHIELWECSGVIWLFIIHKIKYLEHFETAYDTNGLTLKHMSSLCLTYIGTTCSVKGTLNLKSHDKLLPFRRLCWVLTFWEHQTYETNVYLCFRKYSRRLNHILFECDLYVDVWNWDVLLICDLVVYPKYMI